MLIGRRIREFRLRSGLTLEQLEELSGLEIVYLARLEDGLEVPSFGDLEILGDVLGAPLQQFVCDGDKLIPTPKLTPRPTLRELAEDRPTPTNAWLQTSRKRSPEAGAVSSHAGANAKVTDSPDTSTRIWAQTRVGQVALFWGILQVVLSALDAATRLEMMKMLRESLVPALQFLVDPRLALAFVAFAFLLLWEANHSRKPVKPAVVDDSEEPEPKRRSVFGVSAVPFFLALVCGVSLVAVDWNSASPDQATNLTASAPAIDLSLQPDALSPAKKQPGVPTLSGGESSSAGRAEPLARSLPPLAPELDQPDQGATITGNVHQFAKDLSAAVASHDSREHRGSTPAQNVPSAGTERKKTLDRIEEARRDQDWRLMATLSEDAIAKNPQWLTPYELAAEAYVQMRDVDRAIARLEYVKMSGAGSLGDGWAVVQAARLRESIRHQYGK